MAGTRPRGTGRGAAGGRGAAPACAAAEGPADPGARPARGRPRAGGGLWERVRRVPRVPLCFLGLGVYRAWIEMAFVGTPIDYPTQHFAGHNAFDLAMICSLFALAALSRRVAPLHERRLACPASLALLLLATAGGFLSMAAPQLAPWLAWPCAIMGGAGIAVMILLWSELYACLSPVRICLYYATSLLAGAAIVYVYRGFMAPWQPAMVCLLPVVSLLCLRECYRRISDERRPPRAQASFTFPWKPIAVVAIYAFAFGLQEVVSYADWGPHSSPGMVACALVVVAGIALLPRFVEFGTIYATWLPFLSATFLILPALGFLGGELAGACSNLGYAASEIYVMTMIGSISYHYGVRAVWLFGIERGVRAVAMLLGRGVESAALAHGLSVAPVIVVAVLVATFMVFTEKRLSSAWGVRLRPGEEGRLDEAARRSALVERCAELGGRAGLSQREEEVLLLLAERKTAGDVERELLIANGTAKAHIGHIYQKLGVHSREELFDLLGVERGPDPAPRGAAS